MKENNRRKKIIWLILAGILLSIALGLFIWNRTDLVHGKPVLTVEIPQKLRASSDESFTLDVRISHLGEALYPAASMSIRFDSSCLEFLGPEEGHVFVMGDMNAAGQARKLPEWSCNAEVCNQTGQINLMYLDLTGGKYAFSKKLLPEDRNDHVVVRLRFRLRGSVRAGDVYELEIEDAVFAASNERDSLAMTRDTLKTKNGKIVIGE